MFYGIILGCTVRAYDPTELVVRPQNSYHPNLHYYNIGIWNKNGKHQFGYDNPLLELRTLDTLLKENREFGKRITYLKVDVEGSELLCLKQWIKSGVVDFIEQYEL